MAQSVGERRDAVQVMRGDETSWARVLDAARTRSLFEDRRAVVVRSAESLKGEAEDLPAYLEDPTPGVALILVAASVDKRKTAWKRVMERANVVPAEPLKGAALRRYASELLRRRGLALSPEGVEELLERVGSDLRRLSGELDKLEAYAGPEKRKLGAEEVAAVTGRGMARPLYVLGDAFARRRGDEALPLLGELIDEGEEPLKLLGTLHRSLRQVRAVLALKQARVPRGELLARLRLPPNMAFKLDVLLQAAGAWSEPRLRRAFVALERADCRIKSGGEARAAMVAAVAEACGTADPGLARVVWQPRR
jgi:DNA polymerase-3 subunit delta